MPVKIQRIKPNFQQQLDFKMTLIWLYTSYLRGNLTKTLKYGVEKLQ